LPIFSQSSSTKGNCKISTPTPTTPNSNTNAMPIFFTIPHQMFSFTQNLIPNNIPPSPSRRSVPSLDEFLTKLDESLGNSEEFIGFKNIFENDRITVDQIHDLTDAEFDQLGINKIGWRKALRTAAQRYKI
jgi:hypothetical protein